MSFSLAKKLQTKLKHRKRIKSLSNVNDTEYPYDDFYTRLEELSLDNVSPPSEKDQFMLTHNPKATQIARYSDCKLRSGNIFSRSRFNSVPTFLPNDEKTREINIKARRINLDPKKNIMLGQEEEIQQNAQVMAISSLEKISKLASRLVPIFPEGNRHDTANELHNYLDCCKHVHNALASEEEKRLLIPLLKTKLRGEAYDLVKYLDIQDINEFEQLLLNAFAPPKSINDILGEIRKCAQTPGEKIYTFGARLNKYLVECKRAIINKYSLGNLALIKEIEEEACYIFKTGVLSPVIRQVLITQRNHSLDNLIQVAIETEKTEERQIQNRHLQTRLIDNGTIFSEREIEQLKLIANCQATPINTKPVQSEILRQPTFPILQQRTHFANPHAPVAYQGQPHFNPTYYDHAVSVPHTLNSQQFIPNSVNYNHTSPYLPRISGPEPRKCVFCNNLGHTISECRIRQRTPFCSTCNTYGHSFQKCNIRYSEFPQQSNDNRWNARPRRNWCPPPSNSTGEFRSPKAWDSRNNQLQQRSGN